MPNIKWSWNADFAQVVTLVGVLFTGFFSAFTIISDLDKVNAVQNAQIEINREHITSGLAAERQRTQEAIESIRQQIQSEKQDVLHQLDKVDEKLDRILGEKPLWKQS